MIEFTPTASGRYYLRVSDNGNDDTGLYDLIAFRDRVETFAGGGDDTVGGGDDADTIDGGKGRGTPSVASTTIPKVGSATGNSTSPDFSNMTAQEKMQWQKKRWDRVLG